MLDHPVESKREPATAVVLLRADGAALLQHRDEKPGLPNPGLWVFPGGHCEPGESMESCARREFLEETAYHCRELTALATLDALPVDGFPPVDLTVFWTMYDGVQQVRCLEGQALRFVARSAAGQYAIRDFLVRLWDLALGAAQARKSDTK